jgi:radical SAM protein with 4Fe4S-binding SPASM domain
MMQEVGGTYARFHLRVENDGSGMLIANAMAAAQLTSTGVLIAKDILEGLPEDDIVRQLKAAFDGAGEDVMRADVAKVQALIAQILAPSDTYPVFNLEDAAVSPHRAQLIAPLQASVPLGEPEAMTPLLDRLWDVGIPHVTFLAADGFVPSDLVRAVEHAEDLGMIAGVRGRATLLCDEAFLVELREAGVDHVTFPYASTDPDVHDTLCGSGDHDAAESLMAWLEAHHVSAIAEIPLIRPTLDSGYDTVEALIASGADNLSFVAYVTADQALAEREPIFFSEAMAQVAATIEDTAGMAQARFMWEPPVERDPAMTLAAQVVAGPRCSGDVAVRVEINGDVIPARGPYHSAGNLLADSWSTIWNHEVFRRYRERVEAPTRCDVCPGLAICAADCPRDPRGWARA